MIVGNYNSHDTTKEHSKPPIPVVESDPQPRGTP